MHTSAPNRQVSITFNRWEVIVLTNKQTPLKTSTSLHYATLVGNNSLCSRAEMLALYTYAKSSIAQKGDDRHDTL